MSNNLLDSEFYLLICLIGPFYTYVYRNLVDYKVLAAFKEKNIIRQVSWLVYSNMLFMSTPNLMTPIPSFPPIFEGRDIVVAGLAGFDTQLTLVGDSRDSVVVSISRSAAQSFCCCCCCVGWLSNKVRLLLLCQLPGALLTGWPLQTLNSASSD